MDMKGMKARDVMSRDVITIDKDSSIERAKAFMEKHGITKIPVTEAGELRGVISDEELVDKLGSIRTRMVAPSALHVSSVMLKEFKAVNIEDPVKGIVERAKERGVALFPVLEENRLCGVITKSDLLPFVESNASVESVMTSPVHVAAPDDRIAHARRLMVDNGIERLPVLRGGMLSGIISAMDIALFLYDFRMHVEAKHQQARLENALVEHAMKLEVFSIEKSASVKEAAEIMYRENIGCLPVIGHVRKIEGIVSRTDLIKTI